MRLRAYLIFLAVSKLTVSELRLIFSSKNTLGIVLIIVLEDEVHNSLFSDILIIYSLFRTKSKTVFKLKHLMFLEII